MLARREHSRIELYNKLVNKGFDESDVAVLIQTLIDERLQSDARFAESFVRSRINAGKGPILIRAELNQHQIEQSLIQQAWAENAPDWFELARAARLKRFGEAPTDDFTIRAKQSRFLQRRGFDSEHIRYALSQPV